MRFNINFKEYIDIYVFPAVSVLVCMYIRHKLQQNSFLKFQTTSLMITRR